MLDRNFVRAHQRQIFAIVVQLEIRVGWFDRIASLKDGERRVPVLLGGKDHNLIVRIDFQAGELPLAKVVWIIC